VITVAAARGLVRPQRQLDDDACGKTTSPSPMAEPIVADVRHGTSPEAISTPRSFTEAEDQFKCCPPIVVIWQNGETAEARVL
jgi:hypothetical protein